MNPDNNDETYTSEHWVLVHPKTGDRHSFHRSRDNVCEGTVVVDSATYMIVQGRRFWEEYMRVGFIIDKKASHKCIVWGMKDFHDMCRHLEE